uniref:Putative secreted protein n=1 Tax=Aedes albopictus TaxID=7160 RepID=A0A023ELM7_AEDAL|nr:PSME3-interacting protein-like [Aedes albopictus]XP_019933358.1 PSME3-interacting protein-like [Aedes albopictus]XP_029721234.1 PSME3-interacting protein-like [Aedes albopictus]XP_029721235.1 PSME3-interacting protein-like [Aedes albopictus]
MSSGFVTEAELAEARRIRQEEWEKVRTADQPMEAPEEEYDSRSLFERLQEQKQKKDLEYEEAHKLKNMIKGLDDDEVEFLDLVDKNKMNAERKAQLEEAKEMNEFRQKVASLQEKRMDEQIQQQMSKPKPVKAPIVSNRLSQKKILAGVVVPKRKREEETVSKSAEPTATNGEKKESTPSEVATPTGSNTDDMAKPESHTSSSNSSNKKLKSGAMQVIGILPGLGSYRESTDSEESSSDCDCDAGHYDWVGRKITKKAEEK